MSIKEGQSTTRPVLLEGHNYGYWKARMKAFIKNKDEKAWRSMLTGWNPPLLATDGGKIVPKPETEWSEQEERLAMGNAKALNAIFSAVDESIFKLILNCESAKEAWDTLSTHFEGTDKVKQSRIQMLTSRFEELKMQEDESIKDFNARVCDLVNEASTLGEALHEEKVVQKILRSLPKRFAMKVTAIEEANNTKTMSWKELIGNLCTYELQHLTVPESKVKSVGLKAETGVDDESTDGVSEELELLTKNFNKLLKKINRRGAGQNSLNLSKFQEVRRVNFQPWEKQSDQKENSKSRRTKGIKCRECGGFGHLQAECANTLKKKNSKSVTVSWSDTETEESTEEEETSNFVALTSMIDYATTCANTGSKDCAKKEEAEVEENEAEESDEEEITDECIAEKYALLFSKWTEVVDINMRLNVGVITLKLEKRELESKASILAQEKENLEREVKELKQKAEGDKQESKKLLEEMGSIKKLLNSLNTESKNLDQILSVQRRIKDTAGLGFTGTKKSGDTKFVKASGTVPKDNKHKTTDEFVCSRENYNQLRVPRDIGWQRARVCYYCSKPGHIKCHCYRYRRDNQYKEPTRRRSSMVWRPRNDQYCYVSYSSTDKEDEESWFFDSGCSRHMTGVRENLTNLRQIDGHHVTFGDGKRARVLAKGTLNVAGMPHLDDVYWVDGLKANLLSISQLCDGRNQVQFTRNSCQVYDKHGVCVMEGDRASNNCYLLSRATTPGAITCMLSRSDEVHLWHQRLGHINFRSLKFLSNERLIEGIPNIRGDMQIVCGDCQAGKQTRAVHKKVDRVYTKRPLELLHMDPMGPMQVESIGRKRYAFVCIDDYTRYSWITFLCEKSDTVQAFVQLATCLINERRDREESLLSTRSYHEREFENENFAQFCDEQGIVHQFSSPITPQQNGVVERRNRTVQEMTRVILHAKNVPLNLWTEAMLTATYVLNSVLIRSGMDKTSYELWKGRKPTVKHFHVFGSTCYILTDREQRQKLDRKCDEGLFLGYSPNSRAYRVYNKRTKTVIESINVVIDDAKDSLLRKEPDDDMETQNTRFKPAQGSVPDANFEIVPETVLESAEKDDDLHMQDTEDTCPTPVQEYVPDAHSEVVPETVLDSAREDNDVHMQDAEESEVNQTQSEGGEANMQPSSRIQKNHPLSNVIGVPHDKIKTRGKTHVNYRDMINHICYLSKVEPKNVKKALYRLKQATRAWYERLTQFLMSMVGEMNHFLGLQVVQSKEGIFLTRAKYTRNLVKKFGLDKATHMRTPAATHVKITKDDAGASVDQTLYRSMIGGLLCLTASRPDICQVVGVCARYQADPKESHLFQVKWIIKYVSGTANYGLWYTRDTSGCTVGYSDADCAGNIEDRKSTSGGCFFVGNNLVSWFSKKQTSISLSSTEAEYMAAGSCCAQMLWIKQLLKVVGLDQDTMTLYCDNMSAISISKDPVQHSRTKHIDIRHHLIRELVEDKLISLFHMPTEKQLVDILTKPLDAERFETLRSALGLCVMKN
ncbi:unnamed protein product [Rhodiola kirilowii]